MNESIVAAAVARLRAGGLVALPTETVYGLAANAADDAAVRRIFTVKGRPPDHPLILHLPDPVDVARYATDDRGLVDRLAARFWPGPLTLIVRKTARVSDLVTGGQSTVALRIVDHPLTAAILRGLGAAVAMPSANRFGRVSPTTARHVATDLGADVDLIVDGGPARIGVESTIVDLTGDEPAIVRLGAIGPTALEAVLGRAVRVRAGGAVRAPGTLAAHYAPRIPVVLVEPASLPAEIERQSQLGQRSGLLELSADPDQAARDVYGELRRLDDDGRYDVIVAVLPADIEANAAVRDRLRRAAAATSGNT